MADENPTPKHGTIQRHLVARAEIEKLQAKAADALRFLPPLLCQVFLPYTDPGDDLQVWHRDCGELAFFLQPGFISKNHRAVSVGYPYGSIPRLLLAYITTETVRNHVEPKTLELDLGDNLAEFMDHLGMEPRGGPRGNIKPLWEQSKRLFSSVISCSYDLDGHGFARKVIVIADEEHMWWDPRRPYERCLWSSTVKLNRQFHDMMKRGAVPLDFRVLKAVRKSPLELDIYAWLTRRLYNLKDEIEIEWLPLLNQFGFRLQNPRQDKQMFLKAIEKFRTIAPQYRWQTGERGLILYPSPSLIFPR